MSRLSKYLACVALFIGVALFSAVFLLPSGFIEYAAESAIYVTNFLATHSLIAATATTTVAVFNRRKIASFLSGVAARLPARYANAA